MFFIHGVSETLLPSFKRQPSNASLSSLVLTNFTLVTKDGRELQGWSKNSQLLISLCCFLVFLEGMHKTNNYCMISEKQIEVWLQLVKNLWYIRLWTWHIQLCKWFHPKFCYSGRQFPFIRQPLRIVFCIFVTFTICN